MFQPRPLTYTKLRAPTEHGHRFISPDLDGFRQQLELNTSARSEFNIPIGGVTYEKLIRDSRAELFALAKDYTRSYRDTSQLPALTDDKPTILSGHQPTLFHTGVWFKNFYLSHLGSQLNTNAISLVIDNDVAPARSIKVPHLSSDHTEVKTIAFDASDAPIPFEVCRIQDESVFASFSERVSSAISPLVTDSLVEELWPLAINCMQNHGNPFLAIAQSRHIVEGQLGQATWEVPLSDICRSLSFATFAVALMTNAGRFLEVYNEGLIQYRQVNKIRSKSHPVPELEQVEGQIELPFWVWTDENQLRRRLFIRESTAESKTGILSDREGFEKNISFEGSGDTSLISELENMGVYIRPRALVTTMFSRLFLGDFFVHGIGGGKYDQLTDYIIEHFFQIPAPHFAIATMTAFLPVDLPEQIEGDLAEIDSTIRDFEQAPDRFALNVRKLLPHIDLSDAENALVEEKRAWIQREVAPEDRRDWHLGLEEIHNKLRNQLEGAARELTEHRKSVELAIKQRQLLSSREMSYCLFPKKNLLELLEITSKSP